MENVNGTVFERALGRLMELFPRGRWEAEKSLFYPCEGQKPYFLEAREASRNSVNASIFMRQVKMNRQQAPEMQEVYDEVNATTLLVLPYVTPSFHEWIRQQNQQFIDVAGNAYLEGHGYRIWIEGRKKGGNLSQGSSKSASRAFTPAGLRVVFAVLVNPDVLNEPVRTLADAAGVSIGAVSNALRDLDRDGYIRVARSGRFLLKPQQLARRWVELYAGILKPKLRTRVCLGPGPYEIVEEVKAWDSDVQLGGETAMLTKGYGIRPEESLFYGVYPWKEVTRALRLRPDPEGNIVLRERFWNPTYFPKSGLAPSLLIFADEFADGDERQALIAQEMWSHDEDLQRFH